MKHKLAFFMFLTVLTTCVRQAEETVEPQSIQMAEVEVYFLDEARYAAGTEPYEEAVIREIHPDAFLPRLALQAYFDGPTSEEYEQGLRSVLSGCTGFSNFRIEDDIAHVYLEGPCASNGSTYTIANPIMLILKQFDEINVVKIYDAEGNTAVPDGKSDSIPFSLEP
jgi:hypothetical protein